MDEPVVVTAQQDQVFHAGFTAIGPMVDVMRVDKSAASASRKLATLVAEL